MSQDPPDVAGAVRELQALGSPEAAAFAQRFFKTGPGQYGEGDVFLGVRVPAVRRLSRSYRAMSLEQLRQLLRSPFHEARLLALILLVYHFERGDASRRRRIFDLYLACTRWINNWDLVDVSAPNIVGAHLLETGRFEVLHRLAASNSLWERRISMLATLAFIRRDRFGEALGIAARLLHDPHDLIHKAVGWMLREIGQRDPQLEERFLDVYYREMPRTMLRYAIEKLPPERRRAYLAGEV